MQDVCDRLTVAVGSFHNFKHLLMETTEDKSQEDLNEEKIKVYVEHGKLYIRTEDLFALKRVQQIIKKVAAMNIMRNGGKIQSMH